MRCAPPHAPSNGRDHLGDGPVRQQQEKKELWFLSLLDGLRQDEDYPVRRSNAPRLAPPSPNPPPAQCTPFAHIARGSGLQAH